MHRTTDEFFRTHAELLCCPACGGVPQRTDRGFHCANCSQSYVELDGIPRQLVERMRPGTFAVCEIEVESLLDQKPGPGAGRSAASEQR